MGVLTSEQWMSHYGDWFVPVPETGCWLWTRCVDGSGYGAVRAGGATRRAHRVSYEAIVGQIPPGLQMDHLCRVKSCVNPDHLEPVTHRENSLRSNNAGGRNARMTHCLRGHLLADPNVYWCRGGLRRLCKACDKIRRDNGRDRILSLRRANRARNRDEINAKRREARRSAKCLF